MGLHVLSSMATRHVLAELSTRFESQTGQSVRLESAGGIDAAARVRAGEPFDAVVLAAAVVDALLAEGHLVGARVDLVTSAIGIGVPAGTAVPDLSTGDAVKQAVLGARAIGYSTGPSGTFLLKLFDQWGLADVIRAKTVVAPPGVPVASLLVRGDIDLGFQQLSELAIDGVHVAGPLPPDIQSATTFSGAVAHTSTRADEGRRWLDFMTRPDLDDLKRRFLMSPA